jgi:broad specificity phosphatase PhoE
MAGSGEPSRVARGDPGEGSFPQAWAEDVASGRDARLANAAMALDHCLLIVRHGETVLNVEDRMATTTDVDLTDLGVRQAECVGAALAGAHFDRAYASPLRRARLTAEIALAHATVDESLVIDPRLVEPAAGPFEGVRFADLEHGGDKALCEAYARSMDETDPVFPEGAESLESSTSRAREFLLEIERMPGRHFAASHGGFIRILLCAFIGLDPRYYMRLKIDNCHAALIKFWPQPPHQLVGLNLSPT